MSVRTVVVPTDGSELSVRAFPTARMIAEQFGARLLLVVAVPTIDQIAAQTAPSVTVDGPMYVDPTKIAKATRKAAEEDLGRARAAFGLGAETVVIEGHGANVIVAVAKEQGPSIIVMSTRGQGGIVRAVLGSVADDVVRHASCAVVLVPPGMSQPGG